MKIPKDEAFGYAEFAKLMRFIAGLLALLSVLAFVNGAIPSGSVAALGAIWFAAMPDIWRRLTRAKNSK